jgi:hypothetical protein
MSARYVVLLRAVTLTGSSVLRVTENAVTSDLTVIDPATGVALASSKQFYLRGDGANDDLARVLELTLESHAQANTYAVSVSFSVDATGRSATVTVTRSTGANNFAILWSHANTTLDGELFGFAGDTANNGSDKTSTISPSACWVAPDTYEFLEEESEFDATVTRARSGKVRGVKRGGAYACRRLSHKFVDISRVWHFANNGDDPTASFSMFLESTADGTRFEVWTPEISSGSTLASLVSDNPEDQGTWQWDESTVRAFRPIRMEPGLSLYEFEVRMLEYVA